MNNELYHYGVPGMKWGQRKSSKGSSTSSKSRTKNKPKLSKGKKIAIGAAAASVALAGIGAMLSSKAFGNRYLATLASKALAESM